MIHMLHYEVLQHKSNPINIIHKNAQINKEWEYSEWYTWAFDGKETSLHVLQEGKFSVIV